MGPHTNRGDRFARISGATSSPAASREPLLYYPPAAMPEPSAMPATPGDARCLAALCAALEASRGGEAPERLLAGFAEGLGAELAALLRLRDDGAAVRALGSRERRLAGPELLLRLPPGWVTALTEGQAASGTADELPPEARAGLRRPSAVPFELPSVEGLAAQLEVPLPAWLRTPVRAEILVFLLAWVGPGLPWGVLVTVGLARLWRWFIGHPDARAH